MYLQAGKMKRILCFYWLLWYDEPILPALDLPHGSDSDSKYYPVTYRWFDQWTDDFF